jgi:hypothetical protein
MGTEEAVRYYQQVSSHGSRTLLGRLGLSWAGRLREVAILRGSGVSLTRTGDVVRLRFHPNWYTVLIHWIATALNVVLFLLRLAQALLSLVVICLARLLDVLGRLAERLATATVPSCSQEVEFQLGRPFSARGPHGTDLRLTVSQGSTSDRYDVEALATTSLPQRFAATSSLPQRFAAAGSLPQRFAATSSLPQRFAAAGSLDTPVAAAGSLDTPVATAGSLDMPAATAGSLDMPVATAGSLDMPVATAGSLDMPVAAAGSLDMPLATAANLCQKVATALVVLDRATKIATVYIWLSDTALPPVCVLTFRRREDRKRKRKRRDKRDRKRKGE